MMRKVIIHRTGSYDVLKIEEMEEPNPSTGEVLIEVAAIGVNYADCMIRMGLYESAKVYVGLPITPGFEVSGRIKALGEGVEDFALGEEVFAVTRFNAYATHLIVPSHQVFRRPKRFSMEEIAGFPTIFLTAYYAMFELAHPRAGQVSLVHSAAGGVGTALLQLGRIAGLKSLGIVGQSHKIEIAQHYGAAHVIDKSRQDLWKEAEAFSPEGFHVIFDANGVETLSKSYDHLAPTGKLVIYGFHTMLTKGRGRPNWLKLIWGYLKTKRFNPLEMTGQNRSVLAFNLSYLFENTDLLEEAMTHLLAWIDEGKIEAPPIQIYPFDEVARAHADLESGTTVGKLILVP